MQGSTAALVGGALITPALTKAQEPAKGTLKIGLIGCGGRGTGAASQAINADNDAVLWAMGDAFENNLNNSHNGLKKGLGEKVQVDDSRKFVGLDAYKKVIDSGVDVVVLATPPGFRPLHIDYAVSKGKHIFTEKPMAVDAPGVRWVMESVRKAKEQKITLVCGFCWRYQFQIRDGMAQLHDGKIGDLVAVHGTYLAGPVKPMPPEETRPQGMGDVEWQVRNWYNFGWLSGDSITEQAVHTVDKISWANGDVPPIAAYANGGRQVPAHGGNIYDHFSVTYEYADNKRSFLHSRQIGGAYGKTADTIMGTTGTLKMLQGPVRIEGANSWKSSAPGNDMYQQEHNEFFASIRNGDAKNDGDWMVTSTMLAILGRMAAYTGKRVTWEDAMKSEGMLIGGNADIASLTFDQALPVRPMAIPGKSELA